MKKYFGIALAFALALAFTGCPGVDTPLPNRLVGLDDLDIQLGDNPGELTYSFADTTPPADSYTVYFIREAGVGATRIIREGYSREVFAGSNGTIDGFTANSTYSMVVVARKNRFDDLISTVKQITTPPPPSGTLTGLGTLTVEPGNNPGELAYSFAATYPPADRYYLYFYRGYEDNAGAIIAGGNRRSVNADLPGVIDGLTFNATYSVVVVARKAGYTDHLSRVLQAKTPVGTLAWQGYLTVEPGDNPGELAISFAATYPPADYYYLYIYKGQEDDAETIIAGENRRSVNADSLEVVDGLTFNAIYSVVLVARKANFNDLVSDAGQGRATAGRMTGLEDLVIESGDNPGDQATYFFGATYPPADYYYLYFLRGTEEDGGAIIVGANGIRVNADSPGVIAGLAASTTYSIVVVARKADYVDLVSIVRQITTQDPEPGTLTGLGGLNVNPGSKPDELTYFFHATVPAATSYTLYYVKGTVTDVAAIIHGGASRTVNADSPGVLAGFAYDTTFSVVVVARKYEHTDHASRVIHVATSPLSWQADLAVLPGSNPGTLGFSFPATVPAATSYTLYYIVGTVTDATAIIAHGTYRTVEAGSSGVLDGLTFDETYSIVVVARRDGFRDLASNVIQARTPAGVIVLNPAGPVNMIRGGEAQVFTATMQPLGANQNAAIAWSVYPPVDGVTFSRDGMTATLQAAATVAPSAFTVSARLAGFETADATVNVVYAPATGVTVTPNPALLLRGGSQQFSAVVEPPAANQTVTWTRARTDGTTNNGVTVNSNGLVSVGAGATGNNAAALNSHWSVTATAAGGITGSAQVRVLQEFPTGISTVTTVRPLQRGTPAVNLATLFGVQTTPANAPNDLLAWEIVGNPTGITLDGNMMAAAPGAPVPTAVSVRISVPGFQQIAPTYVTVNVLCAPANVTINQSNLIGRPRDDFALSATVVAGAGQSDKIVWSASPANAGTFISTTAHETVFTVADLARPGTAVTITARAVFGGAHDVAEINVVSCLVFPGLAIRRGGPNPNGIHIGAIDHRALAYSFNATYPPADSYTLHFIAGVADAARIISEGTSAPVEPRNADAPGFIGGVNSDFSYTLHSSADHPREIHRNIMYLRDVAYTIDPDAPVFGIDGTYSVVVVAQRAGHENLVSSVVRINPIPNNTLTIPDIPAYMPTRIAVVLSGPLGLAGIGLTGAAGDTARIPIAVGYRLPGTGIFVFYQLDVPGTMGGTFDPSSPWNPGVNYSRAVALASTERQPPTLDLGGPSDGHYRHITAGGLLFTPNTATISHRTTLNWSRFRQD